MHARYWEIRLATSGHSLYLIGVGVATRHYLGFASAQGRSGVINAHAFRTVMLERSLRRSYEEKGAQ
jgi:hypothetical protein